jgi:hypothetical protein
MKFMSRFRFGACIGRRGENCADYSGCKAESNRRSAAAIGSGREKLESFAAAP